jgi:ABC-type transport system involved in Fe-S cluster assembly fused permease/ATPase subunit
MRRSSESQPAASVRAERSDLRTLKTLLPYLLRYKLRVAVALSFMLIAKFANVGVPLVLKHIIDALSPKPGQPAAVLVLPVALLVAYGALRLSTSVFTELREMVFARATQRAVRDIALQVFQHLHALSLRFHLDRQTGGMTRDIERGTRAVSSLVSYTLYSILPTLVEVALVLGILATRYDIAFTWIAAAALTSYIVYTISVTEWRTSFRRAMNELDSSANVKAIDSLINYETVKYFNNETFEAERYDASLARWEKAAVKSQVSLSLLNTGQAAIIAVAVSVIIWRATRGVIDGSMTLGDLVLVNAFMIQLYVPLNFLGVLYREIKQSLADMDRMFSLLDQAREVADKEDAGRLRLTDAVRGARVVFKNVHFGYDRNREILHGVDLVIEPGKTLAVVGPSGSGKSTLARLLFRFYDVWHGSISIDGQDLRDVTQSSLRESIGIVPQDTVLFNDTIYYNIAYGRTTASRAEVEDAARAAYIHDFIVKLPAGYDTMVGERGLKLSGGEKQRVAIARSLLKAPAILVFDEATSALDSRAERAIQSELKAIARNHTALVIAHRLSTIVDADEILVLDAGQVIERGRHHDLLARDGAYARMWQRQQAAAAIGVDVVAADALAEEASDGALEPSSSLV